MPLDIWGDFGEWLWGFVPIQPQEPEICQALVLAEKAWGAAWISVQVFSEAEVYLSCSMPTLASHVIRERTFLYGGHRHIRTCLGPLLPMKGN